MGADMHVYMHIHMYTYAHTRTHIYVDTHEMLKGGERKEKCTSHAHIVVFLDCLKTVCGHTGGGRSPYLGLLSWASLLVKQLVTYRTRMPSSDHQAIWAEPDPEP